MENTAHKQNGTLGFGHRFFGILFPRFIFNSSVGAFILLVMVFLLPFFVLPGSVFPGSFAKTILFQAGIVLAAIILIGTYLREQAFSFPRSSIFYAAWMLALSFVIAGALSPVPRVSFFGVSGELGTVVMVVLGFGGLMISSLLLNTSSRLRMLVLLYSIATLALLGYEFLHGILGDTSSSVNISSLSTFDIALLFGGALLVALSLLYFYREKWSLRFIGYAIIVCTLSYLIAIDLQSIWVALSLLIGGWLLIISSDIATVLRLVNDRHSRSGAFLLALGRVPRTTLLVFMFVVACSFGLGHRAGGALSPSLAMQRLLHVQLVTENTLSQDNTLKITRAALSHVPYFGVGPNRFADAFLRYKDAAINATPVWDKVYDEGFGYLPTFVVTAGLVTAAFLLYFLTAFFWSVRYLRSALLLDRSLGFLLVTSFGLSAFFLFFAIVAVPGIALFGLTFVFIGAFVAALRLTGFVKDVEVERSHAKHNMLLSSMALIKLLALILIGLVLAREAVAYRYYQLGRSAVTRGDLTEARADIFIAHTRFPSDLYARDISVLALLDLDRALRTNGTPGSTDMKFARETALVAAVSADEALRLDPTNSKNHMQRGAVYEALAALGASTAYDSARESYVSALLLDPTSPELMYDAGRTELSAGNEPAAIDWFTKALALRPDHKGALAAMVSLRSKEQDTEAIRGLLTRAVESDPTDAPTLFALGKIYYKEFAFAQAAKIFASALRANPQYADARFYLAASVFRAGDKDLALKQFMIVKESNPDHELLNQIISAIEQGNDPFVEDPYGTTNN